MWIKIFLKVYAIMQRLKYFHDFYSFLSLQHKAQVIFFFFFFRPVWNYYTFQEVWYASKMNHAITGPFVRIGGSLFPHWDILLCRCGKNGRLKETTRHLLPVNFFPRPRWHLENSANSSSFQRTDCFNFHAQISTSPKLMNNKLT